MNKRQARPPSGMSSISKKSLTEDRNSISVDKNSLVNCSSSNVSVCNNQQRGSQKPVIGGDSTQQASSSRVFSQSDINLRNPGTTPVGIGKEKKSRDRVSLRNFISRALFSNRNDVDQKPKSTSSSTITNRKGRKLSITSAKSAVNTTQSSAVMPATSSVSAPPTLVAGSSSLSRHSRDRDGDNRDLDDNLNQKRCNICYCTFPASAFPVLETSAPCKHLACMTCYRQYLCMQINESRTDLTCPECEVAIHPSDIKAILDDAVMLNKYEQFMIRRVLAAEADTRWCPAPDCGYAVIAAGCAECPRLVCEREECGTAFCYHCSGIWHPDSTCDEARAQRFGLSIAAAAVGAVTFRRTAGNALFSAAPSSLLGKIKPCPRCKALIAKMDDGSCNHMTCTICGADFCWLCMKEISDLHFLSPTGCTFWGKKPWSRKKKLICQLGTLIGAPVGIALVAGVAIPSMIIGIPIWVGRKIHRKMFFSKRYKRNLAVISGVTGAILVSPAVAALVIGFGVPLMLAYVYGVVPFSLCRSGGTCRSSNSTNSVANSTSNLSSDDVIANLPEDDPTNGIHLRNSSMADSGSLDIVTQQLHGSKTPDEQLMLRMMMVLDENDVVFNQNGSQVDTKSVSGTSARIRHRAEINHSHIDYQNASIGEFSMDSDAHSQKKLIMLDPSGQSIVDTDISQQDRDGSIARVCDEERPNFDSASTVALNLSVRRQSISSESVNYSLGDRVTLETISSDLDYTSTNFCNRDILEISEQDNASTKALAGSILGGRYLSLRTDAISLSNQEKSPASPVAITVDVSEENVVSDYEAVASAEVVPL